MPNDSNNNPCRGHLLALANPPPGAQRFFLSKTLLSLADDEKWVKKAILILRENIVTKNQVAKMTRGDRNGDGAHAGGGQESAPGPQPPVSRGRSPDLFFVTASDAPTSQHHGRCYSARCRIRKNP